MSTTEPLARPLMEDIAKRLSKGKCILFLGAGVHSPAPEDSPYSYPDADRPPFGSELAEQLSKQVDFEAAFPSQESEKPEPVSLQRVSLYFELEKSRQQLIQEVESAVQDKKPSPVLRALAGLDFPLVITTNYDHLLEKALINAGKDPVVAIYSPEAEVPNDFPDATPERPFILKLHGDISKPESLVITDEDYIQFVLRMSDKEAEHPVPMTFRYRFASWSTLFVGYSLIDYNLRLLFKTLRWKIDLSKVPMAYSVDRSPDPLILKVWDNKRGYVKFIAEDVWTFVPELYRLMTGKEMPK